MIDINKVYFGYSGRADLYKGIDISLPQGSVYGLLGRNGSGKTTLLYLIAGLLKPRSGRITFMGNDTLRREPLTLGNMFFIPEELSLPKCSFRKYVKRYAAFYPRFSEEMLRAALDEFNMPVDVSLSELSMGNRKKAYVCFALATNVSLLLMDEPTNGLDIPSKAQFRRAVARIMSDERSVIISTHQVRDIDALLDHLLIIDGGRMMLNASTAEVCSHLAFEECGAGESVPGALYEELSAHGKKVIVPNADGRETQLDLETLFNAVVSGKVKIEKEADDEEEAKN